MPSRKRPGAVSASAAAVIASSPGPRVKTGAIADAEPQPGLPRRGQRERCERIGAGHLG